MAWMKGIRSGADGNDRLLKEYGGKSGGGMKNCYAHGGAVHGDETEDKKMMHKTLKPSAFKAAGGPVEEGGMAKPRLDRPGRKMKGKDGKGKGTNVNVVIMQKPDAGGPAGPMPPMGAGAPMPMPPPKPPMPMGGPPMAGGPPMPPMHKRGGKVSAFKHGGKVKKHKADGGEVEDMNTKDGAREPGLGYPDVDALKGAAIGAGMGAINYSKLADAIRRRENVAPSMGRKNGGKVHIHADGQDSKAEKEAESAIERKHGGKVHHKANGGHIHADGQSEGCEPEAEKIVESKKGGGKVCKAEGGPVYSKVKDGAGGGNGRLEKMKAYGK